MASAMVTASHNPPEYNGVKVIDTDGTEMGDREVIQLEDRLVAEFEPWNRVGRQTSAPNLVEEVPLPRSQVTSLPVRARG